MEITYLGREVEPQVAAARQGVLDQQGHLVRQADLDLGCKSGRLAEVDQVLEGECKGDGLAEIDLNGIVLLILLNGGMLSQRDGAVANLASGRELDTILGSFNRHCSQILVRNRPNTRKGKFRVKIAYDPTYQTRTWP